MKALHLSWLPAAFLAAGLLLRLWMAHAVFLNPDEAYHYLLSAEPSLRLVYQASLTTAHPPLYLVVLHYWGAMTNSEFGLRLLSVVADLGFCWIAFLWLCRAFGREVAAVALVLLLFSPPLVWISWEVRQYAVLWFFVALSLYAFDCGIDRRSVPLITLSGASLWLALLTHYSALISAAAFGVYGTLRLWQTRSRRALIQVWAAVQGIALALVLFLFKTHVSVLKSQGTIHTIADTYVRKSIFHPDEEGLLYFLFRSNFRLFHYFFAQGAVGAVGFLLFAGGLVILLRSGAKPEMRRHQRALAGLLGLPFLLNCTAAIFGLFPYGATRHDSCLALFAMTGIAVALTSWNWRHWIPLAAVIPVLLLCNVFPSAVGEHIRWKDQQRLRIADAVNDLQQALRPGSIILTDEQGRFVLTYYLCPRNRLQYGGLEPEFVETNCAGYRMISTRPSRWIFEASDFPQEMRGLRETFQLDGATRVWFFQAGWSVDKEPDLRALLRQFGCAQPHEFGRNILQCSIALLTPSAADRAPQPNGNALVR